MNFANFTGVEDENPKTRASSVIAPRTRGAKPNDPRERVKKVQAAIAELTEIGVPYTVADIAQRSGVSRATIYRNHILRAQIGAHGDGVRSVDPVAHAQVCAKHQSLQTKARQMRDHLRDVERQCEEMRCRALAAEQELGRAQQRVSTLTTRLAGRTNLATLSEIAVTIGIDGVRRARRKLARALHPDLFAREPDVAAVATALLRALNEMAE